MQNTCPYREKTLVEINIQEKSILKEVKGIGLVKFVPSDNRISHWEGIPLSGKHKDKCWPLRAKTKVYLLIEHLRDETIGFHVCSGTCGTVSCYTIDSLQPDVFHWQKERLRNRTSDEDIGEELMYDLTVTEKKKKISLRRSVSNIFRNFVTQTLTNPNLTNEEEAVVIVETMVDAAEQTNTTDIPANPVRDRVEDREETIIVTTLNPPPPTATKMLELLICEGNDTENAGDSTLSESIIAKIQNKEEIALTAIRFWHQHRSIQVDQSLLDSEMVDNWLSCSCQSQLLSLIKDQVFSDRLHSVIDSYVGTEKFPWVLLWHIKEEYSLAVQQICIILEFCNDTHSLIRFLKQAEKNLIEEENVNWFSNLKVSWFIKELDLTAFEENDDCISILKELSRLSISKMVYLAFFKAIKLERFIKSELQKGLESNMELEMPKDLSAFFDGLQFLSKFNLEESIWLEALSEVHNCASICAKIAAFSFSGILNLLASTMIEYKVLLDTVQTILNRPNYTEMYLALQTTLEVWYDTIKENEANEYGVVFKALLSMILTYDVTATELLDIFPKRSNQALNPDELFKLCSELIINERFKVNNSLVEQSLITETICNSGIISKQSLIFHFSNIKSLKMKVLKEFNFISVQKRLEYINKILKNKDLNDNVKKYHVIIVVLRMVRAVFDKKEIEYYERPVQVYALLGLIFGKDEKGLTKGILAQISTGEGKTLIVAMLTMFIVLYHKCKVDVITSSEELSGPQQKENKNLFDSMGITSGIVDRSAKGYEEQELFKLHEIDVLYGTPSSFMRNQLEKKHVLSIVRPFERDQAQTVVIVDEVDNLLFDKRNASLQLTSAEGNAIFGMLTTTLFNIYEQTSLKNINDNSNTSKSYYNIATDVSKKIIKEIKNSNLPQFFKDYFEHELIAIIKNSLAARYSVQDKVSYFADETTGKAIKIDRANTGVLQPNMHLGQGLSQFLHIENNYPVDEMCLTSIFQTFSGFFKGYKNLYGVTGTIGEEISFLKKNYGVNYFEVPRHCNCAVLEEYQTKNYNCYMYKPRFFTLRETWKNTVIDQVKLEMQIGRPVLVLCESMSIVDIFVKELNAVKQKYSIKEIKSYDGKKKPREMKLERKEIMVATNIAGRGTNIKVSEELDLIGGLHVCLTFLPSNERIELQNVGRTARNGNRGSAQIVSFIRNRNSNHKLSWESIIEERKNDMRESLSNAQIHHDRLKRTENLAEKFYKERDEIFKPIRKEIRQDMLNTLTLRWNREKCKVMNFVSRIKDELEKLKQKFFEDRCHMFPTDESFYFSFMNDDKVLDKNSGKYDTLFKKYKWSKYEWEAVNQRWAFWLAKHWANPNNEDFVFDEKISFPFLAQLYEDSEANNLIENPVYLVYKGYENLQNDVSENESFTKAISLAEKYDGHLAYAFYYRAYSTWQNANDLSLVVDEVRNDLNEAKRRIEDTFFEMYISLYQKSTVLGSEENMSAETFKALYLIHLMMVKNIEENLVKVEDMQKDSGKLIAAPGLYSLNHYFDHLEKLKDIVRPELLWSQCKSFGLVGVFSLRSKPMPKKGNMLKAFVWGFLSIAAVCTGVLTFNKTLFALGMIAVMNTRIVYYEGFAEGVKRSVMDVAHLQSVGFMSLSSILLRRNTVEGDNNIVQVRNILNLATDNDTLSINRYETLFAEINNRQEHVNFHLEHVISHVFKIAHEKIFENELLNKALAFDRQTRTSTFAQDIEAYIVKTGQHIKRISFVDKFSKLAFTKYKKKKEPKKIKCDPINDLVDNFVKQILTQVKTFSLEITQMYEENCGIYSALNLENGKFLKKHQFVDAVCAPLLNHVEDLFSENLESKFEIQAKKLDLKKISEKLLEKMKMVSRNKDDTDGDECFCCDETLSLSSTLMQMAHRFGLCIIYYDEDGLLSKTFHPDERIFAQILRLSKSDKWINLDTKQEFQCLKEHLESLGFRLANLPLEDYVVLRPTLTTVTGKILRQAFPTKYQRFEQTLKVVVLSFNNKKHTVDPLQFLASINLGIKDVIGLNCHYIRTDKESTPLMEDTCTVLQAFRTRDQTYN